MRAHKIPTIFVLSVLTALALAITLVFARDGVRTAEAGVPPQINITVKDNLKGTLLPNTCWYVFARDSARFVDVVSDNKAKPVCDSQGPGKADLTDKDPADGSIRITIPAAVISANGPRYDVFQKQAPLGFNLDPSPYFCDLSTVKCEVHATDVFKGKPNIDGLWNIKFIDNSFFDASYNCKSPDIVQTKVVGTSDAITLTGPGTCTDGFVDFNLSGNGTVGGGQVSISNGTIGGCEGDLAMDGPVSWNGNIWSGTWSACGAFGTFEGIRKPTDQQINITVHNNTATGDLLGRTCWQVFYVAFGKNIPVDIVSDNQSKMAACDNLPHAADLTDKDVRPGHIGITILAAQRGEVGDQWHVQQVQTPAGYLRDLIKHPCDLSLGKCNLSVINLYNPTGDADADGCTNAQEVVSGANAEKLGGLRNPKNFWDFFDTPHPGRDKKIDISDVSAVIQRYRSNGNPNIDPLSAPPAAPAYHTAFDRTLKPGLFSWSSGPPNGQIRIDDVSNVIQQYRHHCN